MEKNKLLTTVHQLSERDAVHVAIYPCQAGEMLERGQKVRVKNGKAYYDPKTPDGIVNPFMFDNDVHDGDWFWLCLMPDTVTGMTHHWDHPKFKATNNQPNKEQAKEWLTKFAEELSMSLEELIGILVNRENYCLNYDTPERVYQDVNLMWHYFSIYTGNCVEDFDEVLFHCAC